MTEVMVINEHMTISVVKIIVMRYQREQDYFKVRPYRR